MSKYITQKNATSTYLEFSNLQIASEAFIGKSQSKDPGTIISGKYFERDNLIKGNGHTSKFTETAADEFMQHWRVVEHITNTKTGFSDTLFEAKASIGCALAHHPQNPHCATRRSVHTAHGQIPRIIP